MRTAVGVECRSIEDMKPHGSKRGVWWSRINGRCLQRLTLDYDIWRDVESWFVFFWHLAVDLCHVVCGRRRKEDDGYCSHFVTCTNHMEAYK